MHFYNAETTTSVKESRKFHKNAHFQVVSEFILMRDDDICFDI